jgi:hypothetical protein
MHINKLADEAEKGVNSAGGKGVIFNTITISDGISMGSEGMKYSLVSREVIADSIETVVGCQGFDGIVAIGGCDKNMPGCIMGLAKVCLFKTDWIQHSATCCALITINNLRRIFASPAWQFFKPAQATNSPDCSSKTKSLILSLI